MAAAASMRAWGRSPKLGAGERRRAAALGDGVQGKAGGISPFHGGGGALHVSRAGDQQREHRSRSQGRLGNPGDSRHLQGSSGRLVHGQFLQTARTRSCRPQARKRYGAAASGWRAAASTCSAPAAWATIQEFSGRQVPSHARRAQSFSLLTARASSPRAEASPP